LSSLVAGEGHGASFFSVGSTRCSAIPGRLAGHFVFGGPIRIVPPVDLNVFSL
jgi:hypothetical protein